MYLIVAVLVYGKYCLVVKRVRHVGYRKFCPVLYHPDPVSMQEICTFPAHHAQFHQHVKFRILCFWCIFCTVNETPMFFSEQWLMTCKVPNNQVMIWLIITLLLLPLCTLIDYTVEPL